GRRGPGTTTPGRRVGVRRDRAVLLPPRPHVADRAHRAADADVLHGPGCAPDRIARGLPRGERALLPVPRAGARVPGGGHRPLGEAPRAHRPTPALRNRTRAVAERAPRTGHLHAA